MDENETMYGEILAKPKRVPEVDDGAWSDFPEFDEERAQQLSQEAMEKDDFEQEKETRSAKNAGVNAAALKTPQERALLEMAEQAGVSYTDLMAGVAIGREKNFGAGLAQGLLTQMNMGLAGNPGEMGKALDELRVDQMYVAPLINDFLRNRSEDKDPASFDNYLNNVLTREEGKLRTRKSEGGGGASGEDERKLQAIRSAIGSTQKLRDIYNEKRDFLRDVAARFNWQMEGLEDTEEVMGDEIEVPEAPEVEEALEQETEETARNDATEEEADNETVEVSGVSDGNSEVFDGGGFETENDETIETERVRLRERMERMPEAKRDAVFDLAAQYLEAGRGSVEETDGAQRVAAIRQALENTEKLQGMAAGEEEKQAGN